MSDYSVTHEALEGFEGFTDRGGKTVKLNLAGNPVNLSVRQAKALNQCLGTLLRKNKETTKAKAIVLKERKPKVDKATDADAS